MQIYDKISIIKKKINIPRKENSEVFLFMQEKEFFSVFNIFNISKADSLRFRKIVIDVMSEACQINENEAYDGIGTLAEKQMHAAIKRFICPDVNKHEIKIDGSAGCIKKAQVEEDNSGKSAKSRRFVADILDGNIIYEIQTGSFAPLRDKIQWILDNTTYNIAVIHPIAETKWISYINEKSGNIENRKKSPIKGKFTDIAPELYYFRDFISSPRFSLIILMMEAEQYKKNIAKSSRGRPKYRKYELIPISLLQAYVFKSKEDYQLFIPKALPEPFTVKEYSRASKIHGINAYSIVKTLCHIGLLQTDGKIGRAIAYKKSKKEEN